MTPEQLRGTDHAVDCASIDWSYESRYDSGKPCNCYLSVSPATPTPDSDERDELIAEVKELFDEGWCVCCRSGLGDRVLAALEEGSHR